MKKTHDYIHHYRGYWSDEGRCRIRIYREGGRAAVVVCSQLPDNRDTSVTNMAEYLAAEVVECHRLPTPIVWVEHYPENRGRPDEWALVSFSSWAVREVFLGGAARRRVGSPRWAPLSSPLRCFYMETTGSHYRRDLGGREGVGQEIQLAQVSFRRNPLP